MQEKVAIIYQANISPSKDGIIKPMKSGGYSDSGADIAYTLMQQQITVITPVETPQIMNDFDWVFPDTKEGIQSAIDKGATVIWLNTVLYKGHPIEYFLEKGISVVGQIPENVDVYDDKWLTNELLKNHKLPVPASVMITHENLNNYTLNFSFPVVVKPVRGRGSQGVSLVNNQQSLDVLLIEMLDSNIYGNALYVEEYLTGEEVTITIMPPGDYIIHGENVLKPDYWSLPPVKRFNHQNGIAPYNGVVAIVNNSAVLSHDELSEAAVIQLRKECEFATKLVNAKAPVRIDCRANAAGKYFLFDLNMKPNMTGAARPHRPDQDSLTALAAQKIGWSFSDLVVNVLKQYWSLAIHQ
jgi:D-alanine-D-alanine ligase